MPCHRAFWRRPGSDGGAVPAGVSLRAAERRDSWVSIAFAACQRASGLQPRKALLRVRRRRTRPLQSRPCRPGSSRPLRQASAQRACRPVVVAQLLEVIFDLHAYRAHLPNAALPLEPWPGRVLLTGRRLSLHCRGEPDSAHAGGRDSAASGLVAQICDSILTATSLRLGKNCSDWRNARERWRQRMRFCRRTNAARAAAQG